LDAGKSCVLMPPIAGPTRAIGRMASGAYGALVTGVIMGIVVRGIAVTGTFAIGGFVRVAE